MADAEARRILDALRAFGPTLSIKLYRLTLDPAPAVPLLPCLDHEAMLHATVAPHMAVYVQDGSSGDLHELVFIPERRVVEVDTVSTWEEHSTESSHRMQAMLGRVFPEYQVKVDGPSWWRGERRVAEACRAQVSLRDVLLASDLAAVKARVDRLQTIGALMEKQSRVTSWGVRTMTAPLLAATGVISYLALGRLRISLGETQVSLMQSAVVGLAGAAFLYYGMKAVQLTEMANRVWKRSAEYSLILAERKRLQN